MLEGCPGFAFEKMEVIEFVPEKCDSVQVSRSEFEPEPDSFDVVDLEKTRRGKGRQAKTVRLSVCQWRGLTSEYILLSCVISYAFSDTSGFSFGMLGFLMSGRQYAVKSEAI